MAWKTAIVRRLEARNVRELDPMYITFFSLLDKKCKEVKAALDESQHQVAADAAVAEKESLYRSAAAQLFEAHQENRELHITLDLLRAQLEEKRTGFNQLKHQLGQIQEKNARLEAELESALTKNMELEAKIEPLTAESVRKDGVISDLERQIEELREEYQKAKSAHEIALSECSALRETFESMHEKVVNEAMENSRLKSINEKLTRELSQQTKSLESSQEGSPVRLGTETSATLPVTLPSSRQSSARSPSPPMAAKAKDALNRFTSLFRSSSSDDSAYSRLQGEEGGDDFHMIGLPDICVASTYPTKASYEFTAHESECSAVKWSPMSRYLATAGSDRSIKLWSVENLCIPASLQITLTGCPSGILALEFDTSETNLAAACSDRTARIYRLSVKKEINVLSGHSDSVTAVRFGGSLNAGVVTCSRDRTIRLWDSSNFSYVIRTIFVTSRCNDLVLLTGGGFSMASGHANKKVCFWDHRADLGKPAAEVDMSEKVTSLDVSMASPYILLAMTKDDDALHLIDCRVNKVTRTFTSEGFIINSENAKAVLSPDAQYLCAGSMVGSMMGSLHVWNSQTGRVISIVQRKEPDVSPIVAVAWQPAGRYVASVDKRRRCTIWSD